MRLDHLWFPAVRAGQPHQALRHDRQQRGAQQVGFDAEVKQARDCRSGSIGMQCAQQQVSGQRALHGDIRGFPIANFTDLQLRMRLSGERPDSDANSEAHEMRMEPQEAPTPKDDSGIWIADSLGGSQKQDTGGRDRSTPTGEPPKS